MHRGDAACHQADQDRWEDDRFGIIISLGNVWKSHEMSREFWKFSKNMSQVAGGIN